MADGAPPAQASHTLGTPTGVTATPGDGQLVFRWTAVADANAYRIQYGEQLSGTTNTSTTNSTSSTLSSLTNGRFYRFRVQAFHSGAVHTAGA